MCDGSVVHGDQFETPNLTAALVERNRQGPEVGQYRLLCFVGVFDYVPFVNDKDIIIA
jgi:hypothetical protein